MSSSKIDFVQVDSLVVMKIIKHIESERQSGGGDFAHGYLTGLVALDEKRLEVTNCFPTARAHGLLDDADREGQAEEDTKQMEIMQEMLRRYRQMNIDYELVGFYQSHPFGACFTKPLVESMHDYQSSVEDGVVLIYDPIKTGQGQLSLKTYRLSQKAMELCYSDLSPESVKQAGLTYATMFEELELRIKNSHLVNVMLCELSMKQKAKKPDPPPYLELGGTGLNLEKCLRQLMGQADTLNRSVNDYNKYMQQKEKQESLLRNMMDKRKLENEQRRARGEPPLAVDAEEMRKSMRWPQLQDRDGMLGGYLAAAQVKAQADHALQVAGENLGKLFITESIVADKPSKERSASSVTDR